MSDDYLATLTEIASTLSPRCTYKQLNAWANRGNNDFPKPAKSVGRYNFYNRREVEEWYTLWRRATVNQGRPSGKR